MESPSSVSNDENTFIAVLKLTLTNLESPNLCQTLRWRPYYDVTERGNAVGEVGWGGAITLSSHNTRWCQKYWGDVHDDGVCVVIGLFRVKAEIATNLDFNCGRRRPLEPLTTWLRVRLCSRDGTLDSPSRGICRLNHIKPLLCRTAKSRRKATD